VLQVKDVAEVGTLCLVYAKLLKSWIQDVFFTLIVHQDHAVVQITPQVPQHVVIQYYLHMDQIATINMTVNLIFVPLQQESVVMIAHPIATALMAYFV
jgi:hypothetical protein